MTNVFEDIVAWYDRSGQVREPISLEEYNKWREEYIFLALRGQRYGQSFCNKFNVNDNHLYYNTGDVSWADDYIRKNYIERT